MYYTCMVFFCMIKENFFPPFALLEIIFLRRLSLKSDAVFRKVTTPAIVGDVYEHIASVFVGRRSHTSVAMSLNCLSLKSVKRL